MPKYLDRTHNIRGMPTEYGNRIDLDTALKERDMDGFYGKTERGLEQKELHTHLIKRAMQVGERQAKEELVSGKMFNNGDMEKV